VKPIGQRLYRDTRRVERDRERTHVHDSERARVGESDTNVWRYRALLQRYRAFTWKCRALLQRYRALWWRYGALLQRCMALLWTCTILLWWEQDMYVVRMMRVLNTLAHARDIMSRSLTIVRAHARDA